MIVKSDYQPCKDCKGRHYLCHSDCPKYKKLKEIKEEIRENRRKDKEIDSYLKDILYKNRRKG